MIVRTDRLYLLLVAAILVGPALVRLADPFFVQAVRLIAFDSYQQISPQSYDPSLPVRVVDIDEESLDRFGQWPWSRRLTADLLMKLTEQGAATVAFDILFSEPDRTSPEQIVALLPEDQADLIRPVVSEVETNDAAFAAIISQTPSVLAAVLSTRAGGELPPKAGFAVAGDDPAPFVPNFAGVTGNLAVLDEAAAGIGSINWIPDRDQVIRRVPLMYRAGEQFVPTLVTEALRVAQRASTYVLKASNASGETAFGAATGLNHIRVGGIEIPTDADSGIWLQFRPSNPAAYIPAWQVLAGEADPAAIAGNIILVGTSAPGLLDLRATPLDASIPGVEVHAQAIEHILTGRTVTRPDFAQAIEIVLTLVVGLGLAALLPRMTAAHAALTGIGVVTALLVGGWAAYAYYGFLFDPSFPAMSLFLLVAAATTYIYRRVEQQRGEVRRAFSYYVSPRLVDEIIADPDRLELGGEVRDLSILFCDVRNFTSISERMTAHELTHFVNSLLTPLSEIILERRGTIDKYIGDAIMAFWNAPLDDPDHPQHAVDSAIAMIAKIREMNEVWRAEAEAAGRTHQTVAIGIGINTGDGCVGNLGSEQRFDYSVIGDNVNVASRYEGQSKTYGVPIVLGETTVARLSGVACLELDLMRVKGRTQPTRIYTALAALAADDGQRARIATLHEAMLAAYRAADWDAAEAAIAACREVGINGLETLYNVYRDRIADYRETPPPADWDGTFTATSK